MRVMSYDRMGAGSTSMVCVCVCALFDRLAKESFALTIGMYCVRVYKMRSRYICMCIMYSLWNEKGKERKGKRRRMSYALMTTSFSFFSIECVNLTESSDGTVTISHIPGIVRHGTTWLARLAPEVLFVSSCLLCIQPIQPRRCIRIPCCLLASSHHTPQDARAIPR